VVYAGVAVGCGRPLVKNEFRGRTPGLDAFFKDSVGAPELEYFPFNLRKTDFAVNRLKHV
jgi:hypothetical protein